MSTRRAVSGKKGTARLFCSVAPWQAMAFCQNVNLWLARILYLAPRPDVGENMRFSCVGGEAICKPYAVFAFHCAGWKSKASGS
ncbi:MAG: hypothetical protein EGP87_03270 [Paraprevotella clara]|nr:hypothetical protein [Paraprevotella clara]RGU65045.1 hypothetical protein DWW55_02910 [Paraprevotella clara]